jgi:hypothetical protein
VAGPAIKLPTDLDRDGVEYYRQRVEHLLNRLTIEAEAWAEAGTRKVNEVEIRREPSPHRRNNLKAIRQPEAPPSISRPSAPPADPRKYPIRRAA